MLVTPAFERRPNPYIENFNRKLRRYNSCSDRNDIRIVVSSSKTGIIGIVAKRRPYTANLVRCHLFALTTTTQNDSPIGITAPHNLTNRDTERRVIGRFGRVRAKIGYLKSTLGKFV